MSVLSLPWSAENSQASNMEISLRQYTVQNEIWEIAHFEEFSIHGIMLSISRLLIKFIFTGIEMLLFHIWLSVAKLRSLMRISSAALMAEILHFTDEILSRRPHSLSLSAQILWPRAYACYLSTTCRASLYNLASGNFYDFIAAGEWAACRLIGL